MFEYQLKQWSIATSMIIAVIMMLAPASEAYAWGFNGHRVVAEIAYERLNPKARAEVDRLIAESGEPSFAEAATWGDRALFDESIEFDYTFSKKFHYINFSADIDPTYDNIGPACVLNSAENDANGCVVFAIEHYDSVLRSRGADVLSRWEALLFVIHLVGDIHQPLHAGRVEDRGGNSIKVNFRNQSKKISLHKIWDNVLVEELGGKDWKALAKRLGAEVGTSDEKKWLGTTTADWAIESAGLAKTNAYKGPRNGRAIKEAYIKKNQKVVALQLQRAGVRLADLLNQALG